MPKGLSVVHDAALREANAKATYGWRRIRQPTRKTQQTLSALARAADAPLHVSCQRKARHCDCVAAPVAGRLTLEDGRLLRWQLNPSFEAPRLYLMDRQGRASTLTPSTGGALSLPEGSCAAQLVARGPMGPRPIAELDACGTRSPAPAQSLREVRQALGVAALRPNKALSQLIERRRRKLCEAPYLRHRAGIRSASLDAHLSAAGLRTAGWGEVVARGRDAKHALAKALRSPSHAALLQDPAFTDVGVAVGKEGQGACMLVALARYPRWLR